MAEVASLPRPAPWVEAVGRFASKTRRHFQVVLLAAGFTVARPLATPRDELLLLASSAALVAAGGALRSWAMGHHTWRRRKGERANRALITAGPYAHTRNPLYLGSFLTGCGLAAMTGWMAILIPFAAIFVFSHYCLIRSEEKDLEGIFGAEFLAYAAAVPRLFPGLRSAARREGRFDLPTMWRCMEPLKTLGLLGALVAIAWMRSRGITLAG